jgi:hypothetical protein
MSEDTTNTATSESQESIQAPEEATEQETSPKGGESIETNPETDDSASEESSEPRKYTVKIDGEEIEVDETELLRGYQLRKASDQKFREASDYRKQADALIDLLREDPIKALTHPSIGIDFRALAEKYLADAIEDEMATPEEKERRQKLRKLEELERENAAYKQQQEEAQMQQLTAHYRQEYENGIIQALDKSGLPKTNHTVKRMAYYMNQALENGYELQPADVTDLVRKDYMNEIKDLVGASDGQVLLDLLGDDVAKRVRKFDVAQLKKKAVPVEEGKENQVVTKKQDKKMTMDEFNAYLKSITD